MLDREGMSQSFQGAFVHFSYVPSIAIVRYDHIEECTTALQHRLAQHSATQNLFV